jgi:hypothetical protein
MESKATLSRIIQLIDGAFDINEALLLIGISRKTLELLREKVKCSKIIPKFMIDNLVNFWLIKTFKKKKII